jgi:hypothetical protein
LAAAFSPDGGRVLTGSRGGTARVWDARTGQPAGPELRHAGPVWAVAFSPDGGRVLTGCEDNTARVWDLRPDERPAADVQALAQLLSGHAFHATGALLPLTGEQLQRLWDDLRQRYPEEFTVSPAAARAWRVQRIGDCLREGNLVAAEFHYWWLVAEMALAARPAQ